MSNNMIKAKFDGGTWDGAEFQIDPNRRVITAHGQTTYICRERLRDGTLVFQPAVMRKWAVRVDGGHRAAHITAFVTAVDAVTAMAAAARLVEPFGVGFHDVLIEALQPTIAG
jgi:hypothetical protein